MRTNFKHKILNMFYKNRFKLYKAYFNLFFSWLPIDEKKIVFCCHKGSSGFSCNPKYILEEILKENLPYKLIWLTKKEFIQNGNFPKEVKLVDVENINKSLFELSTSKLWIDNSNKMEFFKKGLIKKKNQKYINTWHGSLGIKKIDFSAENFAKDKIFYHYMSEDSGNTDIMLSNSEFESEVYKTSRHFKNKIEKIGHARNDIFFKKDENLKAKIKASLGIDENSKILLYVPSFRDNLRIDCYDLDYEKIKETLENKLKGNWQILSKFHPKLVNKIKYLNNFSKFQKDVTLYDDIQELLFVSDIVISDYSSCMFDFMLTRRPCFIFATDIERYDNERGFYYPLKNTPFPIAKNNEELISNILNFDEEKYKKEVEEFLKEKNCIDDGFSSKRAVEIIKKIMENRYEI